MIEMIHDVTPSFLLQTIDINGETPLDKACRYSTPQVVQFLLSKGYSVTAPNGKNGALISAILNMSMEYATAIVSMLLDAGANINHKNSKGNTALLTAIEKRGQAVRTEKEEAEFLNLCSTLINRGINVNAANHMNETALHAAVNTQDERLVKKLIASKSEVNCLDYRKFTPLFKAFMNGNKILVELLINCGANPRAHIWKNYTSDNNDERNALISFIIHKSMQCLTLQNMSEIAIRKNFMNVERLPLPPPIIKLLNLKD
ncbi:serine/threonine-protein phosphatase 6 regulatory ankyrin repeat subunit A-like isoform X2 [Stegodyphus dumicola]|nr:serine/threonine-protein phosphatase 6 regulatory ankyrin repeat subunit A-like isoform X2 [Stegodyphus dumicola]XP_035210171.1 serine/threonine-protein phosphatase 6 regulatory ankyrin repeat subunit A-like isoform X2 [Stegodyphus dumicola]